LKFGVNVVYIYYPLAQSTYEKFGFGGYELDPEMGGAMFWQKSL
jgi:hypothetical protein